jgi:hypothetical protein
MSIWAPIFVTLRTFDRRNSPHEVEGLVPYPDCPIAVTPAHTHDSHDGWERVPGLWTITHRPTGFNLGLVMFDNPKKAQQVLSSSAPSFPGWLMATGYKGDPATSACRVMFRSALALHAIEIPGTVAV